MTEDEKLELLGFLARLLRSCGDIEDLKQAIDDAREELLARDELEKDGS